MNMKSRINNMQDLENAISSVFNASLGTNSGRYEKTKKLLSLYRICIWSLNFASDDIKKDLIYIADSSDSTDSIKSEQPKHSFEELLAAAEQRGFDVYQTWISRRIKSISKTFSLLSFMDSVLKVISTYPYNGKVYHQILHLNFFDSSNTQCTGHNIRAMNVMGYTNEASYFKHKKEAVLLYSKIFWDIVDQQLISDLSLCE